MFRTSATAAPPAALRLRKPAAARTSALRLVAPTTASIAASCRSFSVTAPLCKANKKQRRPPHPLPAPPPPPPSAMGGVFAQTPLPSADGALTADSNADLEYLIPQDVLPQHEVQAAMYERAEVTIPPETQKEIVQEVLDFLRGPHSQQAVTTLEARLYKRTASRVKDLKSRTRHPPDDGARLGKVVMEAVAKKRYLDAEFEIAQLLTKDFPGSPKNMSKSLQMLASLASRGHTLSQYVLGTRYITTRQDLRAGIALLEKAAANGHREALTQMGLFYRDGLGKSFLKKDVPRAIRYFEDARKQGSVAATFYLGTVYALNPPADVENPQSKAYELYQEAAYKGLPAAQHNLGCLLFEGTPPDVFSRDIQRAIEYWSMAAENKHPLSQINLAKVYMDGASDAHVTVKKDYARAEKYLRDFIERRENAADAMSEDQVTDEHTQQAKVLLEQVLERRAAERDSGCVLM
ncbi:hypothetical protein HDU86_002741 [Geranomyces michiganensis]|nr:hypothetical protein HDU86_002741 [Geranomyces michiganensis]